MNKKQLVDTLSQQFTDVSKKNITDILETALNLIDAKASAGEDVYFDSRKFKLKVSKARNGCNPRTGEPIKIPEAKYVQYRKRIKA